MSEASSPTWDLADDEEGEGAVAENKERREVFAVGGVRGNAPGLASELHGGDGEVRLRE